VVGRVLTASFEQDFLSCSLGRSPPVLARVLHWQPSVKLVAETSVSYVLEADLKNCFGSLSHDGSCAVSNVESKIDGS
jgi:RNA-directed DNA polymerase